MEEGMEVHTHSTASTSMPPLAMDSREERRSFIAERRGTRVESEPVARRGKEGRSREGDPGELPAMKVLGRVSGG